jgi:hypothetical protein
VTGGWLVGLAWTVVGANLGVLPSVGTWVGEGPAEIELLLAGLGMLGGVEWVPDGSAAGIVLGGFGVAGLDPPGVVCCAKTPEESKRTQATINLCWRIKPPWTMGAVGVLTSLDANVRSKGYLMEIPGK